MDRNYTFQPVKPEDLKLLTQWLKAPELARWYQTDGMEDDMEDERIRMQLVLHKNTPIAYVQDYDIHGWKNHHLSYLPENSRGIDTFIGVVDLIGKGHGTNYLSMLATQLIADGAPALGIDPHPDNARARRAYEKVGFLEDGEIESEWGKVVLMSRYAPIPNS